MSALSTTGHIDGITLHCLQEHCATHFLCRRRFLSVNAYLKPEAYVLHNISNSTHQQYLEHFQPLDPLYHSLPGSANRFVTVATMTSTTSVPVIAIIIMNLCYLIMCAT